MQKEAAEMLTSPARIPITRIAATAAESFHAVEEKIVNSATLAAQATPRWLAAAAVLLIGCAAAWLIAKAIAALADRLAAQRAAESLGLAQSMRQAGVRRTPPQVLGAIVFWLLVCVFLAASSEILGLPVLTAAIEKSTVFAARLLAACAVVVLGLLLATSLKVAILAADRAGIAHAQPLAAAGYWAAVVVTATAAVDQLQIRLPYFGEAILLALAAAALALGLSVGLGGRDVMAGVLAGYYVRQRWRVGDRVSVAGFEGTVREVGPVTTIIETDEEGLMHRRSIPNSRMLSEAIR